MDNLSKDTQHISAKSNNDTHRLNQWVNNWHMENALSPQSHEFPPSMVIEDIVKREFEKIKHALVVT